MILNQFIQEYEDQKGHLDVSLESDRINTFLQAERKNYDKGCLTSLGNDNLQLIANTNRRESSPSSIELKRIVQSRQTRLSPLKKSISNPKQNSYSLMVYYLVKRFLTKISIRRRQKLFFKSKHFTIVGDVASEKIDALGEFDSRKLFEKKQKQNIIQKQYQSLIQYLSHSLGQCLRVLPIVYPQSRKKVIWDIILCFVLMYFFIMIPIEIVFDISLLFMESFTITLTLFIFLLIDYVMKMNTVYFEYGQPIIDRYLILNNYFKNGFIIDGVSLIVLCFGFLNGILIESQLLNLLLIIFISQFHYFTKILRNFEESIHMSKTTSSLLNLAKLVIALLYILHIYSCLWFYIGQYGQQQGYKNWLSDNAMVDAVWYLQYLEAFYFSTVTMISVGYGDITPQNSIEKMINILFMFLTCIQLSFSVGTVGEILKSINESVENTTEKIRIMNKYMNRNNISFELQYQIREYIKISWNQSIKEENDEQDKLIYALSENLRNRLIYEAKFQVLEKCSLFQSTFTLETKVKLLKVMHTVFISPEQTITSQLVEFNEPCWCYIEQGQLDLYTGSTNHQEVIQFNVGQHFGLHELFTGQSPSLQYYSQTIVKLTVIVRSQLLDVLKDNPQDYEQYCSIKDKLITKQIHTQNVCASCNCSGHDIQDCPIVHFVVDREKVIKSHQFPQHNVRKPFLRNEKRQKNQFMAVNDQQLLSELSQLIINQETTLSKFYEIANNNNNKALGSENVDIRSPFREDRSNYTDASVPLHSCPKLILSQRKPIHLDPHIMQQRHKYRGSRMQQVSIHQKASAAILKFQLIVKKVIRLQSFQTNKKLKISIAQSTAFNNHFNEVVINYFTSPQLKNYLNVKNYEDLYFLKMKYQIHQALPAELTAFESSRHYMYFLTHNNLQEVIHKYEDYCQLPKAKQVKFKEQQLAIFQNEQDRQNILKSTLLSYMLFPYTYFQKYTLLEQNRPTKSRTIIGQKKARALFQKYKSLGKLARRGNNGSKRDLDIIRITQVVQEPE